jgi:hypothetical protein
MWFMNKIANPIVRLIIRSPLHGVMSASVLLISYTGCKSGKEYTLPVQFACENHTIYIVPGNPNKKTWWRNLRREPAVKLWLSGKSRTGRAVVLEGNHQVGLITQGLTTYLQRFPPSAKMRNVRIDQAGRVNQEDAVRVAKSTVIVRVDLDE